MCRNDSFKLVLKTLLKELFTNKGEILPRKSVKHPAKTEKTSGVSDARTRDKSGSNFPPF